MNGSGSAEDARAALQALIAGNKAHSEEHGRNGQTKATLNGVADGGDSGAEPKEQAGSALRSLFRAEFQKALRPPKAAARIAEIEGEVSRLLQSVAASKTAEPHSGPAAHVDVPEASAPRPLCVEAAMQTDVPGPTVRLEDIMAEEPPPEPPPLPEIPPPKKRSLVVKAEGQVGTMLRTQVMDARRRLHALDKEVTRLTAELKRCRSNVWNQQKRLCSHEAQLSSVIKERSSELSKEYCERDAQLQKQERQLAQELSEARALAAKWSSVAKRQDSMLQQERDHQKGDAQSILAKHPAGEVFLPNIPPDADSEDGYDDGPRRPWQRAGSGGQEDVSLGTSDEEEDDLRGGRARPPTLRSPLGLEDDESASGERSSLPSPSGGDSVLPSPSGESMNSASASGRSPAASPGAAGQGKVLSSAQASPTATVTQPVSRVSRGRRSTSSSDNSTSEDEDVPARGKLGMASLAGQILMESSSSRKPKDEEEKAEAPQKAQGEQEAPQKPQGEQEATTAVPPLPTAQLSSTTSRGRSLLPEDEAAEVTSEEDFEEDFEAAETSRSGD